MLHDGCLSFGFWLRMENSYYELYDFTDSKCVTKFHLEYGLRFYNYAQRSRRYQVRCSSLNLHCNLKPLHGAYNLYTHTDALPCLTLCMLNYRESWQLAKWIHQMRLLEIRRLNNLFGSLLLRRPRSHPHIFDRTRYLYDTQEGRPNGGLKA